MTRWLLPLLLVSACGSSDDDATSPTTAESTTETATRSSDGQLGPASPGSNPSTVAPGAPSSPGGDPSAATPGQQPTTPVSPTAPVSPAIPEPVTPGQPTTPVVNPSPDAVSTGGSPEIPNVGGAAGTTGGMPSFPMGGTGGQDGNLSSAGGGSTSDGGQGGSAGSPDPDPDPPEGTDPCDPSLFSSVITVGASGANFTTVQAAVDSVPTGNSQPVLVQIAPGSYKQKLDIGDRSFLTLCGESADNTTLTFDLNNEAAGGTSASASTTIDADDFSAVRITFENSRPIGSGQSVAILLRGERQQFLDCRFISFQDTLYTHSGSQYFKNCYVQGTVDYVFGGATAVLANCTMYNAGGGSAVSAPNTDISRQFGIVFLGGELTAAGSVGTDAVALGRPWGADGSATYVGTALGAHVKTVGWVEMSGNQPGNARFAEYQTTGPGANPASRVQGSKQLTAQEAAAYTVENIFGGWVPSFSRP